jgi:Putative auto-transporter adhesin, head GIN domain
MRTTAAAVSVLCLASSAALAASQDRDVPAFDSIHVASGIRASVTIGPRKALRVEADDDVLPLVETRVEGRTLHVGFKPNSRLGNTGEVTVTAQTPELHAVAGSGGAMVKATLTKANESALAASGGSEIHVRGVDARKLVAKASGGSVLQAEGRAEEVELNLSGGSHFDGPQFEARDVEVEGSGGAVAELRATGHVSGGLSGGSEMHVRGGARASVHTSGGSAVSVEDR